MPAPPARSTRPASASFDSLPDGTSPAASGGEQLLPSAGLGLEPADDDATRAASAGSSAVVRSLRAEKRRLQALLRTFEADFEAREKRRVKFVRDIAPVLAEYSRYKDVKALLRELA